MAKKSDKLCYINDNLTLSLKTTKVLKMSPLIVYDSY